MKNVQDIFPATPMQELMLLHSIGNRHNDRLLAQFGFALEHALDVTAFEAAWNALVARHPMLRTAFITNKGPTPLQVVRQSVRVPFEALDWRAHDDIEARFARLALDDRTAGFDTRRAPLLRVTVVRVGATSWRVLWTSHHLLMDRWCLTTLFADLEQAYRQASGHHAPHTLATAPTFRQYVDWLGQQDQAAAADYWREALRGFTVPTPLASTRPQAAAASGHKTTLERAPLTAAARRFAVSPVVLVQAALALVLAGHSGRGDVVFGTAAAARPPQIADVESIVGSFVNNLPVRVRCRRDLTLGQWLKSIAGASFARSAAEYLSPLAIAAAAPLPDNAALFDTLFVWLAPAGDDLPLGMTSLWDDMATAYPLTISVAESTDTLTVHAHQYADDPEHAEDVLENLARALLSLTGSAIDAPLGDLMPAHVSDAAPTGLPAAGDAGVSVDPVQPAQASPPAGRFQIPDILVREFVQEQFAAALELDQVSRDADFFALGGNSLRAAALHARVCQGTRKTVPLLTLFQNPTVDGIVATLASQAWPDKPDRMLALRESDRGTPLVCVASPEVNTMGYFVLSRRMPAQQAMYVLQLPPETERPQPVAPDAIEPLAEQYVAALKACQPNGPYQLLGMCGGAHLATAMARRLLAAGDTIAFFGVVNTWSLYSVSWVYYLHRARRIAAYYRRRVRALVPGAGPVAEPVRPNQQYVPVNGPPEDDVGLGNPWIRDVGFAHRWPAPAPLETTVHVLRLERQQYWRIKDRSLGWGRFFRDSNIVDLPGRYHDNLMREPYVADLAEALCPLLLDAAGGCRPGAGTPSRQSQQQEAARLESDPSLNQPCHD